MKEKILSVFEGSLTKVTKGEASYILKEEQGVCVSHFGLAILHLKSILMQKKNYENSNISPCKIISSKRNQNPSRYYYNSITNLKFH